MITLSNIDAEKVFEHLTTLETYEKERLRLRTRNSTKDINRVRMLGILKNKIDKKLNKVCPERGLIGK